jgi:hypothetical protein
MTDPIDFVVRLIHPGRTYKQSDGLFNVVISTTNINNTPTINSQHSLFTLSNIPSIVSHSLFHQIKNVDHHFSCIIIRISLERKSKKGKTPILHKTNMNIQKNKETNGMYNR